MNEENNAIPYVLLRAIEPEDLDSLYRIENDVKMWGVGATNVPYSRYSLHNYIAQNSSDIYVDKQVRLIIEDKDHHTVGLIDLVNFDPQHLRAEIGIVIQTRYRNQGYAWAAMEKIISYAHSVLHLHQLYAIVSTNNPSSLKLFQSFGFQYNMQLKDWLFDGDKYFDAIVMQYFL